MLLPALTDAGPVLLTDRSAEAPTMAVLDPVLLLGFGSAVVEIPVALFVIIVPFATVAPPFYTILKEAEAPFASVAIEQLTVPVPPPGGFMQVNAGPTVCISDTKVVPAGSVSLSMTLWAPFGPLFPTLTV